MKTSQIRQKFVDFFVSKRHSAVRSSSLVPGNDPTLLFTNSGMVQFKDVFLGTDKRPYSRATSSQRCVRAGGKHNDLENVGYTARHHTFFEMLGNFSFGDYFKTEAIHYAWELLTTVYQLPKEKLWVTVYHQDDEAYNIWKDQIGVPAERIIRIGDNKGAPYASDNFWQMADTGPCGPCSEIFYDHGDEVFGGPPGSPDADGDRYIEIWNLVFMQFNRDEQGVMHPLPKPCVDTGMGLERIAAVLQHVHSNYDIDLFQNLIKAAAAATHTLDLQKPSLKVIADHLRAACFLIVDGVFPSNEGRGYVLRRIVRRALRHGHQLGCKSPFFHTLVSALITEMGDTYPELKDKKTIVENTLKEEETRFGQTLSSGMAILEEELATAKQKQQPLSGDIAFKLYDTYGFPFDLTADVCREHGISLDEVGFDQAMEEQRNRARQASKMTSGNLSKSLNYNGEDTQALCYDTMQSRAKIVALFKDQESVLQLNAGETGVVILDASPFYAESGGQVGDTGELLIGTDHLFVVSDTQKVKNQIIGHYGHVQTGRLSVGDMLDAKVDKHRRRAIMRHHSATHLLHKALRLVLGEHVSQKGSLVDDTKTRFDFSHNAPLTQAQIQEIEHWVNHQIIHNRATSAQVMSYDQAISHGAMALFGEKYGDEVRVLGIGDTTELCGGTHVKQSGDIGFFTIVSEAAIASGVRRIEAVCGEVALHHVQTQTGQLGQIAQTLKVAPEQCVQRLDDLLAQQRQLQKDNEILKQRLAEHFTHHVLKQSINLGSIPYLSVAIPSDLDSKALRVVTETALKAQANTIIIAYWHDVQTNSAQIVIGVAKSVSDKHPALTSKTILDWLLKTVEGGRGGGKGEIIQAGGFSHAAFVTQQAALRDYIASLLNH